MASEFLPLPWNLPPCHHTCDLSLPKQEQRDIGHGISPGIIIVGYSKRRSCGVGDFIAVARFFCNLSI